MYQSPKLLKPFDSTSHGVSFDAKCQLLVKVGFLCMLLGTGGMMIMQVARILG
jgi:hypothetical protein